MITLACVCRLIFSLGKHDNADILYNFLQLRPQNSLRNFVDDLTVMARVSGTKIGQRMMDLKADLTRCVREGLSRSEILDFVNRDYSIYALSIRTLDRRLREYQIFYNKRTLLWMNFFAGKA